MYFDLIKNKLNYFCLLDLIFARISPDSLTNRLICAAFRQRCWLRTNKAFDVIKLTCICTNTQQQDLPSSAPVSLFDFFKKNYYYYYYCRLGVECTHLLQRCIIGQSERL